jgi:hypothetical protein
MRDPHNAGQPDSYPPNLPTPPPPRFRPFLPFVSAPKLPAAAHPGSPGAEAHLWWAGKRRRRRGKAPSGDTSAARRPRPRRRRRRWRRQGRRQPKPAPTKARTASASEMRGSAAGRNPESFSEWLRTPWWRAAEARLGRGREGRGQTGPPRCPVGVGPGTAEPRQGRRARREGRAAGSGPLPRGRAAPAVRSGWARRGSCAETRSLRKWTRPVARPRRDLRHAGADGSSWVAATRGSCEVARPYRAKQCTRPSLLHGTTLPPAAGPNMASITTPPIQILRPQGACAPGAGPPECILGFVGFREGQGSAWKAVTQKSQKLRLPSSKAHDPKFRVGI